MTKKLWSGLIAACLLLGVALSWAVVLPQPATWTMYSSGSSTASTMPFMESQAAAAERYFQTFSLYTPVRACWRLYWGAQRSGPYTDMSWKDKTWTPCSYTGSPTYIGTTDVNIAPPYTCSPGSVDTRCFIQGNMQVSKSLGCVACTAGTDSQFGNPINAATGNKYQQEVDFEVPGSPWLSFARHYNSSAAVVVNTGMGRQWRHSLTYRMLPRGSGYEMARPDGSARVFSNGTAGDADEVGYLEYVLDAQSQQIGWKYTPGDGQVEQYDMRGRILQIAFQQGGGLTYAYGSATDNEPSSVEDHFGRRVLFEYDEYRRMTKVTAPSGLVFQYTYTTSSLLATATGPTGTRTYKYDESANDATRDATGQLTGIVDENNVRFATFKYDKYNRAYSTEHAGSVGKFTVAYGSDGISSTVTTPLGAVIQQSYTTTTGLMKAGVTTTSCPDSSCVASTTQATYDSNGNRTSNLAANGTLSCMAYDLTRNLMTRQVDGLASTASCSSALATPPADSRVTTISWHASLRKPEVIVGPLKVTAYGYDAAGRVISTSETPTNDANGALGSSAQATGASRQLVFAYNAVGQLLSVTGPRVTQVTSYAYDTTGNRITSTDAGGLTTTYSAFDGDGRPRAMTLPSGAQVSLQYDGRGRLSTLQRESENTGLGYNAMNQLTSVNLPNGETLTYGYDAAQRLTTVTDSRGQKVSYTLNADGQQTLKQVLYSNSSVAASATRVFDILGRLKQVTGAQRM